MTTEKEKSKNSAVINIITVLNFNSFKIFLMISKIFYLKHGIKIRTAKKMKRIIANKIINKYWLIFIKILSESYPEFLRLLNIIS